MKKKCGQQLGRLKIALLKEAEEFTVHLCFTFCFIPTNTSDEM